MHHKIKKILIVLLITIASLITASIPIISTNAEAFTQQQLNDLRERIDDAAKARHATRVLHHCAAIDDWWDSSMMTGTYSYNQAFNGKADLIGGLGMFRKVGVIEWDLIGSIGTGRWLESKVQGGYQNGNIDCGDDGGGMLDHIVDVTAETLGTDRAGILCDGSTSGLLKNVDGQPCGGNSGKYARSDNWESHLKKLYEARINDLFGDDEELKSMFSWDTAVSNNYDGIAGYSLYVTEIKEANCGGEVSDLSHSHIETPLKNVDANGNVVDVYYAGDDGNGSQIVSEDGFVTRGNNGACGDYIGFANEHFPAFQQLVLRKIKEGCYDARKQQVEDIQGRLDSLGEGERESVEAGLNTALGLISEYENGNMDALVETYVDSDGNASTTGGLMCKKIDGLEDVGMEDYTSLEETDETTTDKPTCYDSGGAKSLGWIVCPLLDWMSDASNYLYDTFIKPSLNIQPYLFSGQGNSATRDAWNTFRNIANVCFIIVVLAVIFSQVTGVGIDNYGIKKILPKLIIVAILVNLSYIFCQACVDLSNILGNALQAMFDGLALSDPPDAVADLGITSTVVSAIALAPIIFGLGVAIWDNPAIVLTFFVSLLGVIISVLFLFILLAARQAAVVVLIVLSPVAAICYALPNTKSLSDKWVKFFQGLLMVYPIAGLLVGGGNFVSRLLLNSGFAGESIMTAITAMVVGIVPIFFIPTVLKGAFAAMGSLGAKISGMGNQLGHAATRGIRGTEAYKNAQASSIQRRTRHKAGLQKDGKTPNARGRLQQGLLDRAQNGGRGSTLARGVTSVLGTDSHLNRNRRQYLKDNEANNDVNSLADMDNYNRAVAEQQAGFDKAAVAAVEAEMAMGFNDENGKHVSANDRNSVVAFHENQLAAANAAQNRINQADSVLGSATATSSEKRQATIAKTKAQEDLKKAVTNVKAAQNNLMQSDGGREAIMDHYDKALKSGHTGGLQEAASHLVSEHGGTLKASSQGDNEMALNIANANSENGGIGAVIAKNNNGEYKTFGAEKYDSDSLTASDNRTLDHFAEAAAGAQSGSDVAAIAAAQEAAAEALQRNATGELAISGEKKEGLQKMVANRHVFRDTNGNQHVAYAVNSGGGTQYYDAHGASVNTSGWTRI